MENIKTSIGMPLKAKKDALQFSSVMRGPIISDFSIDNSRGIQAEPNWRNAQEINKEEASDNSEYSETSDSESEEGALLLTSSKYDIRSGLQCISSL